MLLHSTPFRFDDVRHISDLVAARLTELLAFMFRPIIIPPHPLPHPSSVSFYRSTVWFNPDTCSFSHEFSFPPRVKSLFSPFARPLARGIGGT